MSWTLGYVEKRLDWKDKVNFKIYFVTAWLTNNSNTHITQYLEKSNGNQSMKFGQLIEYNMTNMFLEKSYAKCGGETIPRPYSKKSNLSIALDQWSKVPYSLFVLFSNLRVNQINWN